MAKTQKADIILPETFADYVREESVNKNALFASGAIRTVPGLAITKGAKINVPFVKQLVGSNQVLADNAALTVSKLTTGAEIALVNSRGDAFGINDLASAYAGEDLVGHVGEMLADYWAKVMNDQAIAILKGVAANSGMADHVNDVSAAATTGAVFSMGGVIDTEFLLGDARGKIAAWIAHSNVVALAEKQDLIQYLPNSEGKPIRMFRGKPVIEDDALVAASGVYTMFGLTEGALGYAEGLDLQEAEIARDALAGDTNVITRRSYVLHPAGFATALNVGTNGESPADSALATGTNWSRVKASKNVGIVAYKFKLVPNA